MGCGNSIFATGDLSNFQRICASLKVICRAQELSWTYKYRKVFFFFFCGGRRGGERQGKFLPVL